MAEFYAHFNELQFDPAVLPISPLKVGDWICIQNSATGVQAYTHHRVIEVYYPKIKLSLPVIVKKASTQPVADFEPTRPESSTTVAIFPYSCDFDTLEKHIQARAIGLLLDLLPDVMELREYLQKGGHSLSRWSDRISPAALGVLRWIVASNRAHIVQVDQPDVMAGTRSEDRVQGLQGWLQFRIAMGSPEKEHKFISAIKTETSTLTFPTIFAWHGSPLTNWFGILHDGLNVDKVSHGRAHGHGVYHAKDFNTSYGYCHQRQGTTVRRERVMGMTFQNESNIFTSNHGHKVNCVSRRPLRLAKSLMRQIDSRVVIHTTLSLSSIGFRRDISLSPRVRQLPRNRTRLQARHSSKILNVLHLGLITPKLYYQ